MKSLMRKIALVAMLSASTVYGATTGTLNLTGTIASSVAIVVTPDANATGMDLTANQTDMQVAVVTSTSNSVGGYRIDAKDANGSTIKHATLADNVPFTIKYNGVAKTLTTSDSAFYTNAVGGNYVGVNHNVTISYTGSSTLTAGSYSDLITFTIVGL